MEHTDTNTTGNFEVVAPFGPPVDLRADAVDLADAAMHDVRTVRPLLVIGGSGAIWVRHLELWDEAAGSYVGYDAAAR